MLDMFIFGFCKIYTVRYCYMPLNYMYITKTDYVIYADSN